MGRTTQNKVFLTVFIVIIALLFISSVFFDSVYTTMITTAVAIFGGLAIYYQIYKESKTAEGEFLRNLDESFKHEEIWCIAERLFDVQDGLDENGRFVLKRPFQESERVKMMAYLTFFETLYLLVEQHVVTMDEVDQLFRRRFFKAVMNEDIQRHELVRNYYGYVNIYLLDLKWREYLVKHSKKGSDQLATITKHGKALSSAHHDFWQDPENSRLAGSFEERGELLCKTYEDVIRMGGITLTRKQKDRIREETAKYSNRSSDF